MGPNITWQYNTETDVRETGCEFTGITLRRIGSYHDLLRAGKYISQLHKSNDELQECRLPKNDLLHTVRLYILRENSLGQYRCLFTRRQIQPNRSVLKHVLSGELYVPLNLRPQQVVQSVLCPRCNFRGSRKRKRMEWNNSGLYKQVATFQRKLETKETNIHQLQIKHSQR